ncbi:MAG TPA: TraB/GumN family protein, partial [Kofleriaceae bacterium]|nr:TraB/GumN family protein [Kofleriaceae bacterium]
GIAAAIAISTSCGTAPVPCKVAIPDPHAAPLLWRVQGTGRGTVWLYGTIHDAGAEDVPPAVWSLLDAAPVFVSELGDAEPDPHTLSELARLPWGQVLDRLLPAEDWWDLVNALLGVMKEDDLRHARPWFAMIKLISHMAQPPKPSMDDALTAHARTRGLPVERLEPWEAQLAALAASVTVADLSNAIHARHAMACELARLRSAYRTSDLPALTRTLVGNAHSEALLVERNRRWLPQIEHYLAGGGAFIAVGLGHLLGDTGLPAMLEQAGDTVVR